MPYPRNYKSTSYMDDLVVMDIMNQVLSMTAGDALRVEFGGLGALKALRYKLYAILNGLGRKEDFVLSKLDNLVLEIKNVENENVVTKINLVPREEQKNE